MSLKRDRILLENMIFTGHVGVLDEEKEKGQPFAIDLILFCRPLAACESDLLVQTVDYGKVHEQVAKIMATARYDLIERLAGEIAKVLLRTHRLIEAVEITIRKPQAPVDGLFDAMGIQIYREKDG